MRIKPKTPRTEMMNTAIVNKMGRILDPLATELGVDQMAVDTALTRYASLSARVEFDKKEVDFELASPVDTPEQIRIKFLGYMDTAQFLLVEQAERQIIQADLPMTPPEQQPAPLEASEKNS